MEVEDKYLKGFVQKVRKKAGDNLKRIILFGSRARGDNDSGSDYDLLLIFNKVTPGVREFIENLEDNLLLEHFVLFSTFLLSQEMFEEREYEPFLMNARKEGIIL